MRIGIKIDIVVNKLVYIDYDIIDDIEYTDILIEILNRMKIYN